ncbi:enoyl-CoA hydratase/isomerase family protein [Burkholderia multivorans]|uniref:enoyl-CoA hydratase/isomerase family protein n=1 Tax=Burkholderia multivorans TaxID=87883 RepID=UPI001C214A0A|nr:enoyl-CoA hydratase-related protein [Burkholderia multivorans]MBU9480680.1 enoyl-CoA hydratase/isomerase family protein [Burkholderia multivorans]
MTTSNDAPVLLEWRDGIASIRFNRPRSLNAISPGLAECFLECCRQIDASTECRVVLISGEGRAFMAGGDLSSFYQDFASAPETAGAMIEPMNAALHILVSLPVPVVASLRGAVAGAGMSVALASDLAIASRDVQFSFGYTQIGASPDVGISWSLPRIVGLRQAMGIAMLGESIGADRALELGLVNRVVPEENLVDETDALVSRLASGPTVAYGQTKRLLRMSSELRLDEQLREELGAFQACASTQDFVRGVSNFIEKKKDANFTGA